MELLCCRLCISCDNAQYGCTTVLKLDSLPTHLEECEHNPKRPVPCEQGCGLIIPMDELKVSMQGYDTTSITSQLTLNNPATLYLFSITVTHTN